MLLRIDLVLLLVNEVESDAHVVVDEDLVWFVHLDAGVLVCLSLLASVETISEQFWSNRYVRLRIAELIPWMEAVCILLLELLVPLWRSRWLLGVDHVPALGLSGTCSLRLGLRMSLLGLRVRLLWSLLLAWILGRA